MHTWSSRQCHWNYKSYTCTTAWNFETCPQKQNNISVYICFYTHVLFQNTDVDVTAIENVAIKMQTGWKDILRFNCGFISI